MKKFIGAIVIIFGLISTVSAQEQRHVFTHHYLNPVVINPGATGFNDSYGVLVNYANKWSGFDEGPRSFTLSYDGPVANRLSLGALLFRDGIGSLETLKGQLSYAYKIPAETYEISVGLTTEYIQYGLIAPNNGTINFDDPLVLERLKGARFFDVAAGVYGHFNEDIKFGLVLPGLVRARLDNGGGTSDRTINYIVHLAYQYDVPDYDFYVEPSIFIKQLRGVPFHADVNVKLGFMEDQLIGGLSYALGYERVGFLLGTTLNNFRVFYSYNISLYESQQYHNGMHEFTLGLNLVGSDN